MVGYSLPDSRGELVKYQTCLIFLRPFPTVISDPKFTHLATGMSVNLMVCQLHFPACRLMKQACQYRVSGLSQIWRSRLYLMTNRLAVKKYCTVGNFNRPVCNCSLQACSFSRPVGKFSRLGPRIRKMYNRQGGT